MNQVIDSTYESRELDEHLEDVEFIDDLNLKPYPFLPILFQASGLYEWKQGLLKIPAPHPIPKPLPIGPQPSPQPFVSEQSGPQALEYDLDSEQRVLPFFPFRREELRLDTDGRYPQKTASGTLYTFSQQKAHWVASLTKVGSNHWQGNIWYKDGSAAALPYTNVDIKASGGIFAPKTVKVRFYGGGAPAIVRTFAYQSRFYHKVEFEFDCVTGTTAVTAIDTHAHPNRPAALPAETLTIQKVFQRAGFDAHISSGSGGVPIAGAGADHLWTDMEMHDAMQIYWSKFANKPQWAMWVLFAAQHKAGSGLGGIMFDSIGPNHRQGTAMFNNSFIANAPVGDPNPAAWVNRMKFWTAVHEMGHAFNLAHSWQKHLGTQWTPLMSDTEARSFMNYPYYVSGGQGAFFGDFDFRFINEELLFMRHAPSRFVEMGNEAWFSHHGLEQSAEPHCYDFQLQVRANRERTRFEYLEPVQLELKLKNISNEDRIVNESALIGQDHVLVLVQQPNGQVKRWQPFAQYCEKAQHQLLKPQASIYGSLPLFAGTEGWLFTDPGRYQVLVITESEGRLLTSNSLELTVMPPRSYEEQVLAQDFFSDDVARTLAFGGSNVLTQANDVLHELVNTLPAAHAATHAAVALVQPQLQSSQVLALSSGDKLTFKTQKPSTKSAAQLAKKALLKDGVKVAETLGHIAYHRTLANVSEELLQQGDVEQAQEYRKSLLDTLTKRKVAAPVLESIKQETQRLFKK